MGDSSSDVPTPSPLRRVWDAIPSTNCKGLCAESCGPVNGSPVERRLLADRGIKIDVDPTATLVAFLATGHVDTCPALVDGRCSVYDVRPTVCRLWGATDPMPCPFGCEPDGGRLSAAQGSRLMAEAMRVGQVTNRAQRRAAGASR